jgi:cold shock CspA family protein
MPVGYIKTLQLTKGYGFIESKEHGADVFFHACVLDGLDFDEQLQGLRVEFTVGTNPRNGRERATVVKLAK